MRHNLTGSALYSFPDLKGSNSFVQKALGGWQTSGIIQTRSGLPTNITLVSGFFGNPVRPDYVSGHRYGFPITVGPAPAITSTRLLSNQRTTGHRELRSELSDAMLFGAQHISNSIFRE